MHCSLSQWTMSSSSNICRWSRTLAHLRLLRVYWGRLHSSYFAWALRVERRCLSLASGRRCLNQQWCPGYLHHYFWENVKHYRDPPLKVWHVKRLESLACGKDNVTIIDQVAAGFFCFIVFARARFSDGQNAGGLILDVVDGSKPPQGYFESSINWSKTSYTLERKTGHFQMVAQIMGLTDSSWALCWARAMKKIWPCLSLWN